MINTPKLKILVIPSWYPPDGGYFFREHSIALAQKGFEVDVIYGQAIGLKNITAKKFPLFGKTKTSKRKGITEHTCKFLRIPFLQKANIQLWQKKMLLLFERYLKNQGKPDLILAHSSIWAGVVASRIEQKHLIPYIITEHRSRFVNNFPAARKLFKPWFFPLLEKAFKNASAVVTVSDSLQPFIKEIAPKVEPKIRTIFNMVDTEFFAPPEKPGINDRFTFFSLGNLELVKGFDTLINSFSLLPEERIAATKLVIGGDGSQRQSLKKLVSDKGLEQSIFFTGKLSQADVLRNYQQADAFVLASNFEAFGVVYIEAMSCGLPVIATKAGGPQGFIGSEQGILVEPANLQELAKALLDVLDDYGNFGKQQIRSYTVRNFSHQVIANQYYQLFTEILKTSRQ